MKTIELEDEDYKVLMDLAAELQTQPGDHQAHPVFWTPSSIKREVVAEGCGEEYFVDDDGSVYTLEELCDREHSEEDSCWDAFEADWLGDCGEKIDRSDFKDYRDEFKHFMLSYYRFDLRMINIEEKRVCEENFSFFKSDVQGFCDTNQHHLGKNPATYGHTLFRMPKMQKLLELVAKMNLQELEDSNNDIKYAIRKKEL
jgi:hypothetical protein